MSILSRYIGSQIDVYNFIEWKVYTYSCTFICCVFLTDFKKKEVMFVGSLVTQRNSKTVKSIGMKFFVGCLEYSTDDSLTS